MAAEKLTRRGREMQRILERCERSGLTLSEFARRQRMPLPTLAWWRHRLRRAGVEMPKRAVGAERRPRFTEVVVSAPRSTGGVAEVVLRSGRWLSEVRLTCDDLGGPGGALIPARQLEILGVHFLNITQYFFTLISFGTFHVNFINMNVIFF